MKSLAVLFFGMFLLTHTSFANQADVSFFTSRGERFQIVLNGRLINRYATDRLHLPAIPAGFHLAEIRLADRFGALISRTRIYVEPGFKTDYLIQLAGRRPKVVVSKVRQYPLPVVGRPLPGGYRQRTDRDGRYDGNYRGREDYRDDDRYDNRNDNDRYDNRGDDDRYENQNKDRSDDSYTDRNRGGYSREVMSATAVDRLLQALAARPFEDDKMSLARQALGQNAIYAEDLKRVLSSFSFDKQKLELARQLYPNVYDQRNFYVVYDAFRYDSDRRELERYISSLPR
jgi:hypothetical protein